MESAEDQTLSGLLRHQAERHTDKDFIVFEDDSGDTVSLRYGDFALQVNRLANHLAAAGLRKGEKLAVMLSNRPEFLIAWFATAQAGGVLVPVNTLYSPDELAYLLQNSDSVGLITEPAFLPVFKDIADRCGKVRIRIQALTDAPESGFESFADIVSTGDDRCLPAVISPDDLTQIIYTSGTTSRPKGAAISHRSSILQGRAVAALFGMTEAERMCIVLPLFHVNGQYVGAIPTLTAGGTIVLLQSFSARKFWNQVKAHRCTFMSIVPMLLRTMLAQPPRSDDAEHEVRASFYALPTSDEEWDLFESRFGIPLIEGYGLSETLGICTSNPLDRGKIKRHCIGPALPGREIRIVDDVMNALPAGESGAIIVRGGPLFSGYYRNDEATRDCMNDDWFLTGDNGFLDQDGYLHFLDRSKDIIKRAGENIAAGEVERVLNDHPAVAESAVIGVFDPLRDEAVKAFIVCRPGKRASEEELRDWCLRYLAKFKVPSFIEFRDSLPKTSIGKTMKYVLKAEHEAQR